MRRFLLINPRTILALAGVLTVLSIICYLGRKHITNSTDNSSVIYSHGLQIDHATQNLGTVWAGKVVRREFVITNTGSDPAEILSIRPSCGCMTVDGTRRVLRPGERYQIAVTFTPPSSSADRDAQFRRFILLSAKTSSGPTQIELAITGILPADVSLRYFPSTIDVGRLEPGSLTHRTVHLIGSADVIASTGGSPRLKTQQDSSLSIPDGASSNRKLAEKDVDVLIEVPHDVPAGLWQKSISLKAEGNATDFRISVRGQTVPPIWATRPIVILPNFIGPSAPQVETTLNTTDGENLSIVGTDTSLPIVLEYQKVPGPHRGAVTIGIRLARRVYAPATGDIQVRLKHNGNMTVSRIQAVILDSEPSTNTGPELSGILK